MYHSPTTHGYLQPPRPPVQATRYYQPPTPSSASNRSQPSSYIPRTPAMDTNAFTGAPPSPSSPFSPHHPHPNAVASSSSSSYRHVQVDNHPPSQYISPGFGYYDTMQTASPAPLSAAALPRSDEQHVLVHELSPHEGVQGTQLTIKCDVNFPPTPPASIAGGASPQRRPRPAGRALRVVFGSHPVQTQVMMLTNRSAEGGQLCQLSAVVPSWSSTGASALGRGNQIPVYVQVLDGNHAIVETIHSGEFTYSAAAKGESGGTIRGRADIQSLHHTPTINRACQIRSREGEMRWNQVGRHPVNFCIVEFYPMANSKRLQSTRNCSLPTAPTQVRIACKVSCHPRLTDQTQVTSPRRTSQARRLCLRPRSSTRTRPHPYPSSPTSCARPRFSSPASPLRPITPTTRSLPARPRPSWICKATWRRCRRDGQCLLDSNTAEAHFQDARGMAQPPSAGPVLATTGRDHNLRGLPTAVSARLPPSSTVHHHFVRLPRGQE